MPVNVVVVAVVMLVQMVVMAWLQALPATC
jgi:hypothetical protein